MEVSNVFTTYIVMLRQLSLLFVEKSTTAIERKIKFSVPKLKPVSKREGGVTSEKRY